MQAHVVNIPLAALRKSPFQPRLRSISKSDVVELMESMEAAGQTTPIVVAPVPDDGEAFAVHQGERRWTAAKLLGWGTINAIVRSDLTPMEARKIALADNFGRMDLTAYEKAKALADYQRDCGTDLETSAAQLGIGRSVAFELQNIWKASDALKDVLCQSDMSPRAAGLLTRLEKSDPKVALRKARALQGGALTVGDIETAVKENRHQKAAGRPLPAQRDVEVKTTPTSYNLHLRWMNHAPSSESRQRIVDAMKEMLMHMGISPQEASQIFVR